MADNNTAIAKSTEFLQQGYCIIKSALPYAVASLVTQYMRMLDQYHKPLLTLEQNHGSVGRYSDPLAEVLLIQLLPFVSRRAGLNLLPTYSYLRRYKKGADLNKHTDRAACEVSCTLYLGGANASTNGSVSWPIYIECEGKAVAIELQPGDMMIYRGCEVPHWRERFEGDDSIHVFLHYVDAQGENADLIYDQRIGVGAAAHIVAPVQARMPNKQADKTVNKVFEDHSGLNFPD